MFSGTRAQHGTVAPSWETCSPYISSKTRTKREGEPPREGRQKTSGAQSGGLVSGQGAAAGQGTKARHRVPPRLMDVTSPMCAALPTSWGSKQGSVPGLLAVLHVSGHASETRPLQLTQITDENDEMSSAACSTYNPPPSMHDLMDPFLGSAFGPASIHLRVPHTILDISHNVAEMSNTAFSTNVALLSSSTTFAYSNPIKHALMRPLNNEHITPENGAQPHYSSYDAESASQCIDVTGRTIADCAQQMFSMSATERIEGEWSPQIAMKRCLCPGTPDPPTHLASATMHKKGLLHGTQVALAPDWTPQLKGLQLVCCIAATYGMGPVYGWGASAREVSGKFSNFMHLKQFDSIALTRINSGAPLEGPDEWVCCIDAADAAVTRCE